ncbi:response regulator [Lacinutrix sp. C3R15]|uniref:LytR/AlgR family response regulator transcription factor n=1 Tax=Flavobacteriaceae TaxID=49546 RepID=UPI001C096250|nr:MULTISPECIES: response regulator [Flavobacteriaceae]MBU2938841.1 response regulator [Lacinutrix sp. C3R15]MDO6622154.1 response regulator [Oceanihabitans sp. 1_MG-2023]
MIKTLIVDDEQHCIDSLIRLVETHAANLKIIATCTTIEDALKKTKLLQPDLVFLDIEIHNKTGFDYLEDLGNYNFNVIFTTAFNDYAIKAFKYSAMDYLLKPIDKDDFIAAINRLEKQITSLNNAQQIKILLNNLKKEDPKKTIQIPTSNGFEILEIEDIVHCKADTSYTFIYTKTEKILVSKPLKHFEELLVDANFFRIHNSHLINIAHVKKYTKGKGGYVTMSNQETIDVSIRRKEAFLKLFN